MGPKQTPMRRRANSWASTIRLPYPHSLLSRVDYEEQVQGVRRMVRTPQIPPRCPRYIRARFAFPLLDITTISIFSTRATPQWVDPMTNDCWNYRRGYPIVNPMRSEGCQGFWCCAWLKSARRSIRAAAWLSTTQTSFPGSNRTATLQPRTQLQRHCPQDRSPQHAMLPLAATGPGSPVRFPLHHEIVRL